MRKPKSLFCVILNKPLQVCDELWIIKDRKVHLSKGDFQDYKKEIQKEFAAAGDKKGKKAAGKAK